MCRHLFLILTCLVFAGCTQATPHKPIPRPSAANGRPEDAAILAVERIGGSCFRAKDLSPHWSWPEVFPDNPVLEVDLSNRSITDAEIAIPSHLKMVRRLRLNGTKVTETGLKQLAPLQELRELYLAHVDVNDAGLKALSPLQKLEKLEFFEAKMTNDGLKELVALRNLRSL